MGDDPNTPSAPRPKRPPNAYMLFCVARRNTLMLEDSTLNHKSVMQKLGEEWKVLDEGIKAKYQELARNSQSEFKQIHPDYKYQKRKKDTIKPIAIRNCPIPDRSLAMLRSSASQPNVANLLPHFNPNLLQRMNITRQGMLTQCPPGSSSSDISRLMPPFPPFPPFANLETTQFPELPMMPPAPPMHHLWHHHKTIPNVE